MKTDYAAAMALFLLESKGNVFAIWKGHMPASQQRQLFGKFLGKGTIYIDGTEETVEHCKKVCFGYDSAITASLKWREL